MKKIMFLVMLPLLVSCNDNNSDLKQWVKETSQSTHAVGGNLPATIPYVPYSHQKSTNLDAFNPGRLKLGRTSTGVDAPDENRAKEPLESFDLANIKMVGSIEKAGVIHALVKAGDKVYTIGIGNYMGADYGKVTSISPESITLEETVEDVNGDWTKREKLIELTETTEGQ